MTRAESTGTAHARSARQRLEALQKANTIRAERSRLKKGLAAGRVQITDLLVHPPEYAETGKSVQ